MKLIFQITNIGELTRYLKREINKDDFDKGGKLEQAYSSTIRDREYYLCDAYDGNLCLMRETKRRNRMPNGRVVQAELVGTLFSMREVYGKNRNGMWKVPDDFVSVLCK